MCSLSVRWEKGTGQFEYDMEAEVRRVQRLRGFSQGVHSCPGLNHPDYSCLFHMAAPGQLATKDVELVGQVLPEFGRQLSAATAGDGYQPEAFMLRVGAFGYWSDGSCVRSVMCTGVVGDRRRLVCDACRGLAKNVGRRCRDVLQRRDGDPKRGRLPVSALILSELSAALEATRRERRLENMKTSKAASAREKAFQRLLGRLTECELSLKSRTSSDELVRVVKEAVDAGEL